jgi:hypothetical protein
MAAAEITISSSLSPVTVMLQGLQLQTRNAKGAVAVILYDLIRLFFPTLAHAAYG